jgi:hypothetical protein
MSNNLRHKATNLDDHPTESVNEKPYNIDNINNNEPIILNTNVNLINIVNVNIAN